MRPSTPSGLRSASRPATNLGSMRRLAPVLIFLVWAAPAQAKPNVSIQATPTTGQAPLAVTLSAAAVTRSAYHWDLGTRPRPTGRSSSTSMRRAGSRRRSPEPPQTERRRKPRVVIISAQLTLRGPKMATYGRRATFKGRIAPALRGAPITLYSVHHALRSRRLTRRGASPSRSSRPSRPRTPPISTSSARMPSPSLCAPRSTSRSREPESSAGR